MYIVYIRFCVIGIVYMYIYFYLKICKVYVYMENNIIYDWGL